MVNHFAVAVWGHAKMPTAGIEERQVFMFCVLPLAVERSAVEAFADFGGVPAFRFEEAAEPLVEVVLARVPAALVKQRDVVPVLDTGEGDAALERDHLFSSVGVDAARDVAVVAVSAP